MDALVNMLGTSLRIPSSCRAFDAVSQSVSSCFAIIASGASEIVKRHFDIGNIIFSRFSIRIGVVSKTPRFSSSSI
jgi:hypothetical protein